MCTIAEMNRRLQRVNLRRELPVIVEDNADVIAETVRGQLRRGEDGTGNKITPDYLSDQYAKLKNQLNAAPGLFTPDLNLTGSHYAGISLESVTPKLFTIGSTDSKSAALQAKYGPIYALSPKSWEALIRDYFRPQIQQYITNITKLAFV